MVNKDRLNEAFKTLVEIDSVSREEGAISKWLQEQLTALGAETAVDDAADAVGGETGNLIAVFPATEGVTAPPLLLSAHMDTVEPGRGVRAVYRDGVFTSTGSTILGADDKSAVAILLETMRVITENQLPHPRLELVFSVCEELGLKGAKHLDYSKITATQGYALDMQDTGGIVTRAPGANRLEFVIHGKAAHAGGEPENGINAIHLAAKAMAPLTIGRIDHETTCNIGIIEGGVAVNVVPEQARLKGEVRSHDESKLAEQTKRIVSAFQNAVDNCDVPAVGDGLPRLDVYVSTDYVRTRIPEDHAVIRRAMRAGENLGRTIRTKTAGGGSDANVFFQKDMTVGVIGTGMTDVHTLRESIRSEDLEKTARLVLEIIRLAADEA
jgi:tripeptide aminopeptidase